MTKLDYEYNRLRHRAKMGLALPAVEGVQGGVLDFAHQNKSISAEIPQISRKHSSLLQLAGALNSCDGSRGYQL
jgi:hypothetical protein